MHVKIAEGILRIKRIFSIAPSFTKKKTVTFQWTNLTYTTLTKADITSNKTNQPHTS